MVDLEGQSQYCFIFLSSLLVFISLSVYKYGCMSFSDSFSLGHVNNFGKFMILSCLYLEHMFGFSLQSNGMFVATEPLLQICVSDLLQVCSVFTKLAVSIHAYSIMCEK